MEININKEIEFYNIIKYLREKYGKEFFIWYWGGA